MNASHCSLADIRRSTSLLHLPHHHPVTCPLLPSPSFIPDCDMRVTHSSSSSFPLLSPSSGTTRPPSQPLPRSDSPSLSSASPLGLRHLPSFSPAIAVAGPPALHPAPPVPASSLSPSPFFPVYSMSPSIPPLLPRSPTHTQLTRLCRHVRVARPRRSFLSPPPPHRHLHPPNQPGIPPTARPCQPMRRWIGPLPHFIAHEV